MVAPSEQRRTLGWDSSPAQCAVRARSSSPYGPSSSTTRRRGVVEGTPPDQPHGAGARFRCYGWRVPMTSPITVATTPTTPRATISPPTTWRPNRALDASGRGRLRGLGENALRRAAGSGLRDHCYGRRLRPRRDLAKATGQAAGTSTLLWPRSCSSRSAAAARRFPRRRRCGALRTEGRSRRRRAGRG